MVAQHTKSATPQNQSPDVTHEILTGGGLSLAQAGRRFPPYRQDRSVAPSTIWRWITAGVRLQDGRRVRLEAARVSGRWLTSEAALGRFIDRQTPEGDTDAPLPAPAARPGSAEAEPDRIGI